jgi:ABC-type molybdate transport system substrate-binding protein
MLYCIQQARGGRNARGYRDSVAEAARERDTAFVILLDELQYLAEAELAALIMSLQAAAQDELPVATPAPICAPSAPGMNLVYGGDVAGVLALVQRDEAGAAIVYRTDAPGR